MMSYQHLKEELPADYSSDEDNGQMGPQATQAPGASSRTGPPRPSRGHGDPRQRGQFSANTNGKKRPAPPVPVKPVAARPPAELRPNFIPTRNPHLQMGDILENPDYDDEETEQVNVSPDPSGDPSSLGPKVLPHPSERGSRTRPHSRGPDNNAVASTTDRTTSQFRTDSEGNTHGSVHNMTRSEDVGSAVNDVTKFPPEDDVIHGQEDLTDLEFLDNDILLDRLRTRFDQQQPYTYVGDSLVAVNPCKPLDIYTEEFHQKYKNLRVRSKEPAHIFWVASHVHRNLITTGNSQCVVVGGDSGAGKTESTKYILHHLVHNGSRASSDSSDSSKDLPTPDIVAKLEKVNPLLELFGNASTVLNENSSRFGKLVELEYNEQGALITARLECFILERFRVTSRHPLEKNFHVFYALFAGLSTRRLEELGLELSAESYRILKPSQSTDGVFKTEEELEKYRERCAHMDSMLADVGFTPSEVSSLFKTLSAVLLLSNVDFERRDPDKDDELVLDVMGDVCLGRAMEVLGLRDDADDFEDSLLRVSREIKGEKVVGQKTLRQARDGRDALARELYSILFYGVIDRINHNLTGSNGMTSGVRNACIRLLDISGFENVPNHNGFEQFIINSTNEKLHQFFLNHTFRKELEDYKREGVPEVEVDFTDNADIVRLVFDKPEGLIPLLEDEISTNGNDEGWLSRCEGRSQPSALFTAQPQRQFLVKHYAGQVKYSADGFVTKNSDTLPQNLREVVQRSDNTFIKDYFTMGSDAAAILHKSGRASFRKYHNASRRQGLPTPVDGKDGGPARRTGKLTGRFTDQYQKSLIGMMTKLQTATPVFVRCIKPNLQLLPATFESEVVRKQLLSSGLLEVTKVRKEGYPIRIKFYHFVTRYRQLLDTADVETPKTEEQLRHTCEVILSSAHVSGHKFGHSKVFLKIQHRDQLERAMDLKIKEREERERQERERQAREQAERERKERGEDGMSFSSTEHMSAAYNGVSSDSGNGSILNQSMADPKDKEDTAVPIPESEELTEEQQQEEKKKKKREGLGNQPAYNIFRLTERDFENSTEFEMKIRRCVRLVLYIIMFILVLSGALVSRVALIWLSSSQVKNQATSDLRILMQGGSNAEVDKFRKGLAPTRLLLCQLLPLLLAWLACFGKVLFGRKDWPSLKALVIVMVLDLAGVVGRSVFLFKVLPFVDFGTAVVLGNSVCQVPGVLKLISTLVLGNSSSSASDARTRRCIRFKYYLYVAVMVLALLVQLATVPVLYFSDNILSAITDTSQSLRLPDLWAVIVAIVLSSVGWWENYAYGKVGSAQHSKNTHVHFRGLSKWRMEMSRIRQTSFVYTGPVQMVVVVVLFFAFNDGPIDVFDQISVLFSSFGEGFSNVELMTQHVVAYGLVYMQVVGTFLSSYLSGVACRLYMQRMAFAAPILLVAPACLVLTFGCVPSDLVHWYSVNNSCVSANLTDAHVALVVILGVLVWLSIVVINNHVWFPEVERTAKLERLFTFPHRDPIFADVGLQCSRRQDQLENAERKRRHKKSDGKSKEGVERPTVYICATMWHEIRQEMLQLLKSLFRIDFDVYTRKKAMSQFDLQEEYSDLYEPEIHIIFDDAFETEEKSKQRVINSWVKQFMDVMPEAMGSVAKRNIDLQAPCKLPTPYGGRLEWTLPGGTKMFVHLKDKNRIRHRKRWSQILYLYYLLGYRLMGDYKTVDDALGAGETLRKRHRRPHRVRKNTSLLNNIASSKVRQADNIFLMTLDGDVDFRPDSVRLLLDRMKKNKQVAAVCGRIHPIGDGPMVWYQQFEYAVGHWLQKAAEHVFGCVLCCPGCFSLFRASALMDDNVMRMYTTEPTEAIHFIQYEQGEDRWLCTLLLQQGWKIEYCAGADALTFAPETFHDFYIQRRRWSPSTMANIVDLISSWRITVKMNDNISVMFMLYQFILMASSIFAPGLVVYMIAGSYNAVLEVGLWESYLLSVIPVFLYVLLCLKTKTKTQINVAAILSSVYAIVMLLVTIGTIINVATADILSPDVLFLIGVAVVFVVAGIVHPNEIMCLFHGLLYYITVPSTFVFLTVFFLCNLHVVTWGTREGPKKVDPAAEQESQPVQEKGKLYKFLEKLGLMNIMQDVKSFIKQMMGIKQDIQQQQNNNQESQGTPKPATAPNPEQRPEKEAPPPVPPKPKPEAPLVLDHSYWTQHLNVPNSTVGEIAEEETKFWHFLIEEYLHPIKANKEQQEKISGDLISARNNVVFAFMLLNLMFTLVLLQLKLKTEKLKDTFYIAGKYEPVSTATLAIFSLLLLTQFFGMLSHRWGTFMHLIASTRISWFRANEAEERALAAIQEAQKLTAATSKADIDFINPDYSDEEYSVDDETTAPSTASVSPRHSNHNLQTLAEVPEEYAPDYSDSEEEQEETEFGAPVPVQYDRVFDRRFRSVMKNIPKDPRAYRKPRNIRQYERRQSLYMSVRHAPRERRNSIFYV